MKALVFFIAISFSCATTVQAQKTLTLPGTSWTKKFEDESISAIHFKSAGQFSGKFGCAGMGGTYQLVGDELTVDAEQHTRNICVGPDESAHLELVRTFSKPRRISIKKTKLVIMDQDKKVLLEFLR